MELQDKDAAALIRKADEDHHKYRFMEMNLVQKKRKYKKQIPDIKETLNIISLMKKRKVIFKFLFFYHDDDFDVHLFILIWYLLFV